MNTESKAGHDALGASQRSTAGHPSYNYDSSKDKLLADLKLVVSDTQQLIREATDSSAEGFVTLRTRFETKLAEAREKIDRTRAAAGEKTRQATVAARAYVKENPWQTAGVLAAAGVVFGILLGRRGPATKEEGQDEIPR